MTPPILIIDDDPSVCFTVETVLDTAGLSARSVQSGPAGLDLLRSGLRGLILLDIMMPVMDGWATLQAMRDEGLLDGNLVVMLTAVVNPGCEMEPLKDLVIDYIRKPFDSNQLIEWVRDYLAYLQPVGEAG
jgi:hypothetical protein